MGIQTTAPQGGDGGQLTQSLSLSRQGSIYSLTLNDVQSLLGEPLHSMNLEELLRSVLPSEAGESLHLGIDGGHGCQYGEEAGDITLLRSMTKKTVDEAWRDIQQAQKSSEDPIGMHQLGEMTLEDFLAKAGVVAEGANKRSNSSVSFAQGARWLQQYHQHQQAQESTIASYVSRPVVQMLSASTRAIMDSVQGTHASPRAGEMSDPQASGRKRWAEEGVVEKTVERRQKRMIKNRESAARSRARKQAYTNELENKVSGLEEENERLRKEKELESMIRYMPRPEPKNQLRRTSSATI